MFNIFIIRWRPLFLALLGAILGVAIGASWTGVTSSRRKGARSAIIGQSYNASFWPMSKDRLRTIRA
jgi:hypothetical protein